MTSANTTWMWMLSSRTSSTIVLYLSITRGKRETDCMNSWWQRASAVCPRVRIVVVQTWNRHVRIASCILLSRSHLISTHVYNRANSCTYVCGCVCVWVPVYNPLNQQLLECWSNVCVSMHIVHTCKYVCIVWRTLYTFVVLWNNIHTFKLFRYWVLSYDIF